MSETRHQQQSEPLFGEANERTVKVDAPDSGPDEAVGQTFGRYKLLEKVGEGGFGAVWLAEQKEPVRRKVALKIIKLGMDTKAVVARFEAERQALAMMDHPNIAKVLDAGTTELGRPYFVMELVRGIRITDYCDQAQLPTKERIDLFIKVCQAIQHAHQKGVIHRDIKPSNILVTLHDGVPVPKVIDFGIAKATQGELTDKTIHTQFHQFIGTPAYISPEQAEMSGLDIDTRSDIYSLGVLLYELLVGKTPFDGNELVASGLDAMRKTIREKEPARPSTKLATLGVDEQTTTAKRRSADTSKLLYQLKGDLDWIVMKCLEKDRSRRYDTANGLAMDLKRHLNNEPVTARPPSAAYRLQKALRRHKLAFATGGAVIIALVLGVVASTWEATRAWQAERAESAARRQSELNATAARAERERAENGEKKAKESELVARRRAYAADMNEVQSALAVNNLGRARERLYRQVPQGNEPELRGWEWRFLWRQCQRDPHVTLHRGNTVWCLAVSPDGQWLAIGDGSQNPVWDLHSKSQTALVTAPEGTHTVAFAPVGSLLAFSTSGGAQTRIRLWDGIAREFLRTDLPLGGECLGLAFSQDGRKLVSYARDSNEVVVWGVPAGTRMATYPVPRFDNYGGTPGIPFAADRDLNLTAVAPQDTIYLIELATGKIRWSARATDEAVKALALSPDGRLLASGAGFTDPVIRLWDVASGKEVRRLEGHRVWVGGLVFWPDGKKLASASADQTIRLWDLSDLDNVPPSRVLHGHTDEVARLALLPDGRTLASGAKDGSVFLWDTELIAQQRAVETLPEKVSAWCFSPDSQSILALDRQGGVTRRKGRAFQEKEPVLNVGSDFGRVCFSTEGRLLAVGSNNGQIQVWDLQNRTLLRQGTIGAGTVSPVGFLSEGKELVLCCQTNGSANFFQQWSLTPWQEKTNWPALNDLSGAAVSPDGRWQLTYNYSRGDGVLRDLPSGNESQLNLGVRGSTESDDAFSQDGRFCALVSSYGYGKVWETRPWREVMPVHGFLMGIHSAAFFPDSSRFAAGGDGLEAIKLWDLESHLELLTLQGRGSLFQHTAFSPDGNVLGSVNNQGILHFWRAPSWDTIRAEEAKAEPEIKIKQP
jgi:WD40 repeat protein